MTPPTFVPPGYVLERPLGSGKTAHVYLARHETRGEVALKLPHAALQREPVLRRMFENEVQITLGLKHAAVVSASDGHPTGPQAFLALEYCAGGTLDQLLLERGQLPLVRAIKLVLEVSRGLEHTHGRRVIHRDVKPANVFITADGVAKLGDFGTGFYLGDKVQPDEQVGTAFYMAPEIFQGKPATVQSDLYSLGVLAYEVIAGVRPFQGDSYDKLMLAHLNGLPKGLAHHRQETPKEVAQVVSSAMARDPAKRYRSVSEFLNAFAAAAGVDLRPPPEQVVGRASRTTEKGKSKPDKDDKGLGRWFRRKR